MRISVLERIPINIKQVSLLITLLLLSGCTIPSQEAGFDEVTSYVEERISQTPTWFRSLEQSADSHHSIREILAHSLSADDAVCVALINNPRLQASLAELGIVEADLVQAGKLQNPGLSYLRVSPVIGEYNIERKVIFDVMSLFTLPMRKSIERARFQQAKLQAAIDILEVAAKTRKAYYNAIAAEQMHLYLKKIKTSAELSAALAKQLTKIGNWSKLQQAHEQAFYLEITAKTQQAQIESIKTREALIRLLGLSGPLLHFSLPSRLPALPNSLAHESHLEKEALKQRLDIQVLKQALESKARALGLTKATRFVNVIELGYVRNSGQDIAHQSGYEIDFEIPLFDWGDAKIAKAQNIYMQSAWILRDSIISACSEIRENYQIYQIRYAIAKRYQDEIVPLNKQILNEDLLRYNGMLISTFELLAEQREQIMRINEYIEALRDFWLAKIDMQTALMVKSPGPKETK